MTTRKGTPSDPTGIKPTKSKPFRGYLTHWEFIPVMQDCACVVLAQPYGSDITSWKRTSIVISKNGKHIETLNSKYTLLGNGRGQFIEPTEMVLDFLILLK